MRRGGGSFPSSVAALLGFVGLCLLVGAAAGSLVGDALRSWYPSLAQPPGTPPSWLFAPVWTTLYVMIGVAGFLAWQRPGSFNALRLWGWQLAANTAWSAAFFGMRSPGTGLVVILILLLLITLTARAFRRLRREAALLMLPYLAWTLYAAYLNAGFWWLNRG